MRHYITIEFDTADKVTRAQQESIDELATDLFSGLESLMDGTICEHVPYDNANYCVSSEAPADPYESERFSADEQLKAMANLLCITQDTKDRLQIKDAIDKRRGQINHGYPKLTAEENLPPVIPSDYFIKILGSKSEKAKCTCKWDDVYKNGCKCGGK